MSEEAIHPLLAKVRRGEKLTPEEVDSIDAPELLKAIVLEMLRRELQ